MIRIQRLRTRIILFFVALLALVQASAFYLIDAANSRNAQMKVEEELAVGQRVFARLLEQNAEKLGQTARVLTSDFAFREAVSTHDIETLISALHNHGGRIGADAMLFVGLDGQVMADTLQPGRAARRFEFPALLEKSSEQGFAYSLEIVDGRAFQLVAVPVMAPLPIGWVALGFAVDDALARDLRQLTALEVSFFVRLRDGELRTLASTLDAPGQAELRRGVAGAWRGKVTRIVSIGQSDHQARMIPLGADGAEGTGKIIAVLHRSLADALAAFDRLQTTLFVLAALSFVASIVGCFAIALNITDPDASTPISSARGLSILMMDLDRFKYVNDTLGHGVGDHVLREVGRRLSEIVEGSACVARLGGDEFAVLLQNRAAAAAVDAARAIIRGLESPILFEGQPLDVGTSIGIAHFPEHGHDAQTLVRNADIAMYAAKRNKTGFAVYDPHYDTTQQEHLSLLGELRRAVEQNELVLHYQPKISLRSANVSSVEALIRWQHPQRGLMSPALFVPFAEHTGYIKVLTRWVLREAIRQCGEWCRQGLKLQISVNISARDLMNRELPESISALLAEHRVAPNLLCLEITESGFMDDPAYAQKVLHRLSELGVQLAIDDYGTGYSSLSYIMQLPVQELKIDRSFIMHMADNEDISTIVRSTIELGHNLGLKVVAEGVENPADWSLLQALGCDDAQGFYMSPPLDARALVDWMRRHDGAPTALHQQALDRASGASTAV